MSAAPDHQWEWRFASRLEELNRVIAEAVHCLERLGAGPREVYLANLVIEELGTNILKYGFDDDDVHEVWLQVGFRQGTVQVVIEDDGHPFDPLALPEPDVHRPPEERDPGGLGIHLVRQLAGQVDYQRCNGRNRVVVRIDPA